MLLEVISKDSFCDKNKKVCSQVDSEHCGNIWKEAFGRNIEILRKKVTQR